MVLLPGCACCECTECETLSTPESGNVFYETFNFSSCSELPFQEAYGVCRWTTDYSSRSELCADFFNPGIALRYTSLYRCSTFSYQGNVSLIAGVAIGGIHNIAFVEQSIGVLPASLKIDFLSAGYQVAGVTVVLARERVNASQYKSYLSGAILRSGNAQQTVLNGSSVPLSFPLYATMRATRINGVWGGEVSVAGYGTIARSPFTSQPNSGGDGKILLVVGPGNNAESLRPIVSSFSYSQESA